MPIQTGTDAHLFADDVRRRERRQRYFLPVWQILSFILHGLGFVFLVLFTPLREIVIPERKEAQADPNLTAEQFEALAEDVQTIRLNEIMEQLDDLQIVLHNMDMMKQEMLEDYDAFAASEEKNSRKQVKESIDQVVAEQEKALAAQRQASAAIEPVAKLQPGQIADANATAPVARALDAAKPVFPVVDEAQANAQHLLDQAAVKAEFAGMAKTSQAASAVRDVQLKANTMQRESQTLLQNQVGAIIDHPKTLERIAAIEQNIQKISENLAAIVKAETEQRQKAAAYERDIPKAEKQLAALETSLAQQKSGESAKAEQAKQVAEAAEAARRDLAEAEKRKSSAASAERETESAAARARQKADAIRDRAAKSDKPEVKAEVAEAAKAAGEAVAKRDQKAAEAKQAGNEVAMKADASSKAADAAAKAADAAAKAKEAARRAESEFRQATSALAQQRRDAKSNEEALARSERQRARLEDELKLRKEDLKSGRQRKTDVEAMARKAPVAIPAAQRDAIAAQEALVARVKELAKIAENETPVLKPLAQPEFKPDPASQQRLAELDLVEAYGAAKMLETKITESYRDIKAAESAMLRKMSFSAAENLTDVAKVVREDVDAELLRADPRDRATFDRQKAEATKAIREADNMVDLAKTLMAEAVAIAGPPGGERADGEPTREDRLRRMYDLSGMSAQMTAAAAESAVEKAKDLSKLMASAGTASPSLPKPGSGPAGLPQPGPTMNASSTKSPLPGSGLGAFSAQTPELVPGNIIRFDAVPDSASDGVPTKWMYVNSWYVIGPFPNPDRVNIRRRFPPESVVDLDATYVGKDGRVVKWKFEQALSSVARRDHRAYVIPSTAEQYGIWYAYAEVFVDRECDVWLAVGSDDRSDLWINDLHVWGSGNDLKVWNINEGFRKVHLKRGRNRFLARIENGWYVMGWSVCISLTDDVAL